MADIELVIKIPERDYYSACKYPDALIATYAHCIKEGTILPKGHGDLIDKNKLAHKMVIEDVSRFKEEPEALAGLFLRMCDKEQPIIEADTESEDKDLGL